MKWDEQRNLLLDKAAEDERAMAVLANDAQTSDASVGFHAQQAVEKYLKALLCHLRVRYEWDHDLVEKLDALADSGIAVPAEIDACKYLQPYAVQFRYDDIPVGNQTQLDRAKMRQDVNAVKQWVTKIIAEGSRIP